MRCDSLALALSRQPACVDETIVRAQYFIDQRTQTLYFYPPVPLEAWSEGPFITQHLYATDVSGSSHITLRGLGIHHSRGNGLLAINVTGVRVEDCEISGHGQHGVVMNGTDSGVHGSSVYSVGCSGVRVAGGVARTLTAGNMYVTSNRIADFSLVKRTYVPGIFWQGVGNNYSDNAVNNGEPPNPPTSVLDCRTCGARRESVGCRSTQLRPRGRQ